MERTDGVLRLTYNGEMDQVRGREMFTRCEYGDDERIPKTKVNEADG